MRDVKPELDNVFFFIRSAQGLMDCFINYGGFGTVKGLTQEEIEHDSFVMRNSTELIFTIYERMRDALEAAENVRSCMEGTR